jgi:REP element-mobilizing transposase RayT
MDNTEPIRAKIRRWYVPDAVYFITGVTHERRPIFADDVNVEVLRATMRIAKTYHPFEMRAYVFMPDHFHLLIFVPKTTNISKLLHSVERNFTLNYYRRRNDKIEAITNPHHRPPTHQRHQNRARHHAQRQGPQQ